MELSFVLSAIRRRWWLVAGITAMMMLLGTWASGRSGAQFESTAIIDMKQPSNPFSATQPDPDRFISTELEYLQSRKLQDKVANEVNSITGIESENVTTIKLAVKVVQKATTDAITVSATAGTAEQARLIASTYVNFYLGDLKDRSTKQLTDRIKEADKSLANLDTALKSAQSELAKLPEETNNQEILAQRGALVGEYGVLTSKYNDLLTRRGQLDVAIQSGNLSQVVQDPFLPADATPSSATKFGLAGIFAGLILGALAATTAASFSRKVLDVVQLEEVLETEVVGELGHNRKLTASPRRAFEYLPPDATAFVDQLCVRAEASTRDHLSALTVAVIGTQRNAGTTTLALAMAGRFARNGQRVVVVDGDTLEPRVSREFGAVNDGGIPALLANGVGGETRGPKRSRVASKPVYTATSLPEVVVLGVGSQTGSRTLRRTNAEEVLNLTAQSAAQVVIIDGGPLLDLASTVTLSALVDAVVLAVPGRKQRLEPLATVNRLLRQRRGSLLPVMTAPRRSSPGLRRTKPPIAGPAAEVTTAGAVDRYGYTGEFRRADDFGVHAEEAAERTRFGESAGAPL